MFISRMNRFLDKHGRLAIIIIGLLMVIPFMFFWGPSSSLLDNIRGGGSKVGTMYGEPITSDQIRKNLIAARLKLFMQYGQRLQNDQRLDQIMFQQALRRMRVLHEAEKRGLDAVGRTEVEQHVRDMFSQDGRFDKETYDGFIQNMVVNQGLTEQDFIDIARDNIIIQRLLEQVTAPIFVSSLEVEQEIKREYEKFTVFLRHYQSEEYLDDVELENDESVEDFYRKYVEAFRPLVEDGMKPAEIASAASRGLLGEEGEKLMQELQQHEVADAAEKYLSRYYVPQNKRVMAVQFSYADYLDSVDQPAESEVEEYYEENRDDYKVERDEDEDGDSGEEKEEYKPLAEVREEIVNQLKKEKAAEQAMSTAGDFAYDAFEKVSGSEEKDAAEVVRAMSDERGLERQESAPFRSDDKLSVFDGDKTAAEKAFKVSKANPVSNVIEVEDDYYVACWIETIPGHIPELGDEPATREDVTEQLQHLEAVKMARQRAEENYRNLSRQLDSGKDFEDFATALTFEKLPTFSRQEPPESKAYGSLLLTKVSQASSKTLFEPFNTDDGAVVAYLAARETPSQETIEEERSRIRRRLKNRKQRQVQEDFYERLREESETRLREGVSGGQLM